MAFPLEIPNIEKILEWLSFFTFDNVFLLFVIGFYIMNIIVLDGMLREEERIVTYKRAMRIAWPIGVFFAMALIRYYIQ